MSPDGGCGAASRTAPLLAAGYPTGAAEHRRWQHLLRWRTRDFARMGVSVWERQVCNEAVPQVVRERLHRFECDRIALNLQMT